MKKDDPQKVTENPLNGASATVHIVHLPKFVIKETIGLGQVVKQITKSFGIQPCESCEQRAARLDQWLNFSPYQQGGRNHE